MRDHHEVSDHEIVDAAMRAGFMLWNKTARDDGPMPTASTQALRAFLRELQCMPQRPGPTTLEATS